MVMQIMGLREAEDYLKRLQDGARATGGMVVKAGTDKVYGWGIEFGEHRNGKLARRAGGSFSLTSAFATIRPRIAPELRQALPQGSGRVLATLKALGNDVITLTKTNLLATVYSLPIPRTRTGKPKWRRTGDLRRSYHVEGPR